MIAGACRIYGDLARPTCLYGMIAAVLLAVVLQAKAEVVAALCLGLGSLYVGKAYETVGVAKAQANGAAP